MRVIGFNLTKINIEKFKESVEDLKINTKINISNIGRVKYDFLKSKEEIIEVKFSYKINYDPELAIINISGGLILAVDFKSSKEILKQWEEKKMPEDLRVFLFNIILKKFSLKALSLEDELNLPPHISLPLLKKQSEEDSSN